MNMAMKCKAVSLEKKTKDLRAVDGSHNRKDVAADFDLAPSTSTIIGRRKKIENMHTNNAGKSGGKLVRPCLYPDVEEALFS